MSRINARIKSEAWKYFESRMQEWHLNPTEAIHKIIIEHESLEKEKRSLTHDLDVMRQLLNERPVQSIADKKRLESPSVKGCLRGVRCSEDQRGYFCGMCKRNYPKDFAACQKLEAYL